MITDKTQINNQTELNSFLLGMKESERFGWIMENWDIIRKVAPDVAAIIEKSCGDFLNDIGKNLFDVLKETCDILSDTDLRTDRVRQALSQAHTKSREYANKDST